MPAREPTETTGPTAPRRADRPARARQAEGAGQPTRTQAVYVISVAAELAGLHPQTLRIYERKGLVDPARTGGGSRRYSDEDIAQLRRIQELTADGLNLAGVKRVVELEAEVRRLRREVAEVRRAADDAVDRAHRQHRRELVPLNQAVVLFDQRRRAGR